MAATSTRQEALERISKVFHDALERIIPADENQRLKGETFRDFELQAQEFKAALIPTLLEERARLTDSAEVLEAGCCPHCGSRQTRWAAAPVQKEIRGPDGVIVLTKQCGRCRSCGRSFSPSGS
ncbi:MAG: hypothetical protein ACP5I8_05775 [Phycisphaerae bacterium]